jgi:SAM-dependent methyltransferase
VVAQGEVAQVKYWIWDAEREVTSQNGQKQGLESCLESVRIIFTSSGVPTIASLYADIASVSVDQARSRWESLRAPRFDASFAALDCYTESLSKAFPPAKLAQPFDVVSMQFCMHYAFENVQKARCMLENVSRWLRPGGVFIGTIPNAEQLLYAYIYLFLISFR